MTTHSLLTHYSLTLKKDSFIKVISQKSCVRRLMHKSE